MHWGDSGGVEVTPLWAEDRLQWSLQGRRSEGAVRGSAECRLHLFSVQGESNGMGGGIEKVIIRA